MKTRWLIAIGVLVFVYTLIVHAPLAPLYGRFKPATSPVQLVGVGGTLSQGSAAGVMLRDEVAVRDLRWQLQPLQLLLARAAFKVQGDGDGVLLDGGVALLPNGGIKFKDFRASGPIGALLAATPMFVPIGGAVGLELQELSLKDNYPTSASGRLSLSGLSWKLGREPMALGDYEALIEPDADGLKAVIKSLRGPLDVSGDAHLKADRSYDLHLQIRAKAEAPPPLVNMLKTLGTPDSQAYYHIRRKGQLAAPAVEAVQKVSE